MFRSTLAFLLVAAATLVAHAQTLEGKVEVVAKVEGEAEKRLLTGFRLA